MSNVSQDTCSPENIAINPTLASPCGCLESSNALATAVNTWETAITQYNSDFTTYQTADAKYVIDKQKWDTDKTNKVNELTNEKRNWNNCIDANRAYNDGYCEQDIAPNWKQVGWTQSNCGFYRKGICQRSAQQVTNDLIPWLSQNPEPIRPQIFNKTFPSAPTGNNIQCCSQIFDNIDATSVNFNNIKQQCSQEINRQIIEAQLPPPLVPSNSDLPPPRTSLDLQQPQPITSLDLKQPPPSRLNQILIFGGIFLLFIVIIIVILII